MPTRILIPLTALTAVIVFLALLLSGLSSTLLAQSVAPNRAAQVNRVFLPGLHAPGSQFTVNNDSPTRLGSETTFTATLSDGSNITYVWDFGDGATGTGAQVSHTYAAVGSYTATVTAANGSNQVTATTFVTVTDRAIAGLQASNSGPASLGNVTYFTATVQDGSNVVYTWDFGDGATSVGTQVSHTYAAVGSYTATVTAANGVSQAVASTHVTVSQGISGLQIARSGGGQPALGTAIVFTATITAGGSVTYTWSLGDATTATGSSVTHRHAVADRYRIAVTATNSVNIITVYTDVFYAGWTEREILIPTGPFQMGCDSSNPAEFCQSDEQPLHTVTLDAYTIDKYEVTNARYAACVAAGGCTPPQDHSSWTRADYYGNPAYADYPVIHVDWLQARDFCAWEGKRLPTEAEWEKAARGPSDTRKFPWGNQPATCDLANYEHSCVVDTRAVGSYPAGASPYHVMDMAGNVWEWTADWYQANYYSISPPSNPQGPTTGDGRVLRGGSWYYNDNYVRAAYRWNYPDLRSHELGVRCVRSLP